MSGRVSLPHISVTITHKLTICFFFCRSYRNAVYQSFLHYHQPDLITSADIENFYNNHSNHETTSDTFEIPRKDKLVFGTSKRGKGKNRNYRLENPYSIISTSPETLTIPFLDSLGSFDKRIRNPPSHHAKSNLHKNSEKGCVYYKEPQHNSRVDRYYYDRACTQPVESPQYRYSAKRSPEKRGLKSSNDLDKMIAQIYKKRLSDRCRSHSRKYSKDNKTKKRYDTSILFSSTDDDFVKHRNCSRDSRPPSYGICQNHHKDLLVKDRHCASKPHSPMRHLHHHGKVCSGDFDTDISSRKHSCGNSLSFDFESDIPRRTERYYFSEPKERHFHGHKH